MKVKPVYAMNVEYVLTLSPVELDKLLEIVGTHKESGTMSMALYKTMSNVRTESQRRVNEFLGPDPDVTKEGGTNGTS